MKKLLSYDLFLFDFDGLLVNTEDLHMHAYQEMLRRRGYTLDWNFKTYATHAHASTEILSRAVYDALPGLEKEESDWMKLREEKQALYTDAINNGEISLMPGVIELFDYLEGKSMAVVTNSPKKQVDIICDMLSSLKSISLWVTREEYKRAKPAPDGYLRAMTMAGTTNAVGFEDTEKGLQSLHAAKVEPVLIRPPTYPKVAKCVNTFESLLDLIAYQRK